MEVPVNFRKFRCNLWNLKINVRKTKIVIFENGRHTSYDFFMYDSRIEVVTSFKYLGVHLFKNGNWNRTQKRVAQHASFSLHNVFITYNQLDIPTSQKIKLFDTLVSPTLNYGAEVWGHHQGPEVEAVHSKFCRKILGVKKSTNLVALYGELNRFPMYMQRKFILIRYWIKLLTTNNQSLLYRTYNMLKTDADNNINYKQSNWAFLIKRMLEECGLLYIWQNQYNMLINYNMIKQRLLDMYLQKWYSDVNNSSRLETYSLFKHSHCFEEYLDYVKEPKFRISLTQFRTSSHDLAIEHGRYSNVPRNERICTQCNSHMIENEFHRLLICSKFADLRSKYIKRYYYTWPTLQKFQNLLSSNSMITISKLSKFIYFANAQAR